MPGLIIDWDALEMAFESHVPEQRCFLDRTTGALHHDGETSVAEPDPDRFVRVEPVPSREQYRMMERFIATVVHPALKDALQDAIVGKGAFRRFKDALGRYPDERKRWFAFRDALLHLHILDWMKAARIELQEMPAWNLEPPMTPAPESSWSSSSSSSSSSSAEGEPVVAAAVVDVDRAETDALRTYLLSWARSHGEEYRYLFGPAAFARLADDLTNEFIIHRKRSQHP
jgi:hypothetical protein